MHDLEGLGLIESVLAQQPIRMKAEFRSGGHGHHPAENNKVPTTGCHLLSLSHMRPELVEGRASTGAVLSLSKGSARIPGTRQLCRPLFGGLLLIPSTPGRVPHH